MPGFPHMRCVMNGDNQAGAVCWIIKTGAAGRTSQVRGLATAVGLPVVEKTIRLRPPWAWVPGHLCPAPLSGLDPRSDRLAPPWPALLITCGARTIGPALAVRRLSGGGTFAVYVQDPKRAAPRFDLVAALRHDGVSGANVVSSDTAVHGVTRQRLDEAAAAWRLRLKPDDAPLLAVLLGGPNRAYRFSEAVVRRFVAILRDARDRHGARIVVTPSRRTERSVAATLAAALDGPGFRLWDATGDNPYLGMLALADRLVVTGDSVSMISEALATGQPVHVLPLAGRGRRHDRFLDAIAAHGWIDRIGEAGMDWSFAGTAPIDATGAAAERIRAALRERGVAVPGGAGRPA